MYYPHRLSSRLRQHDAEESVGRALRGHLPLHSNAVGSCPVGRALLGHSPLHSNTIGSCLVGMYPPSSCCRICRPLGRWVATSTVVWSSCSRCNEFISDVLDDDKDGRRAHGSFKATICVGHQCKVPNGAVVFPKQAYNATPWSLLNQNVVVGIVLFDMAQARIFESFETRKQGGGVHRLRKRACGLVSLHWCSLVKVTDCVCLLFSDISSKSNKQHQTVLSLKRNTSSPQVGSIRVFGLFEEFKPWEGVRLPQRL